MSFVLDKGGSISKISYLSPNPTQKQSNEQIFYIDRLCAVVNTNHVLVALKM